MKKRMFWIFVSVTLTCSLFASDIPVKKTGQTKSFDTQGVEVKDGSIKDDGFYQKGKKPHYTRDNKKEVVVDHVTHLMWQDDTRVKSVQKQWRGAIEYCLGLEHAGYNDWTLPSLKELNSILDITKENGINSKYFKNYSTGYWTETSHVTLSTAWTVIYQLYGANYHLSKDESYYVRCVRDAK